MTFIQIVHAVGKKIIINLKKNVKCEQCVLKASLLLLFLPLSLIVAVH